VTGLRARFNRPKGPFVAVWAAAFVALCVFSLGVQNGKTYSWDRGFVSFFDEHYYDLDTVRAVTKATVKATIVFGVAFGAALLVVLAAARAYRRAAFWGLAIGGAVVLTRVLKETIERPEIGLRQAEYSFPSGNATVSLAGVVALVLLLPPSRLRRWIALAGAVAIPLYGLALVLLLWHYPSDVLAGWTLAISWVLALWFALTVRA
jgi:membrane-associated phospholipid phosphatase